MALNPIRFAVIAVLMATTGHAQAAPISPAVRSEVLEGLVKGMRTHYALPEKGERLAGELETLAAEEEFLSIEDSDALVAYINRWLREHSNDLHLHIRGPGSESPMRRVERRQDSGDGGPRRVERRQDSGEGGPARGERRVVVGPGGDASPFHARLLEGGVGYLKVDRLMGDPAQLDAALRELKGAQAVIYDLRDCPGGGFPLNVHLSAPLFDEPTVLMYRSDRTGHREPVHVQPRPETPSFSGMPAYVLTNARTGSACEEVTWDLKYHDKALVVGQRTAGAGLGLNEETDLGHGFTGFIPDMRPVHPNTPLGFEGTGVAPDITVDSTLALETAHLLALQELQQDAEGAARQELVEQHAAVASRMSTELLEAAQASRALRDYEGRFQDGRVVEVRNGRLLTSKGPTRDLVLLHDEGDTFRISRTPGQKMRFIREAGQVTALQISEPEARSWRDPEPRESL